MKEFIASELRKTAAIVARVIADGEIAPLVEAIVRRCVEALRAERKILFAGNGGSAADAQHLASELVGRLAFDRPGLAALALTSDASVLTAIGNDYGYERVFARQIDGVGQRGDVFFGISTSGRSANVLNALGECRRKGIVTVGLTGQGGGDMVALCDHCIRIPATETPKVQEGHIVVGHIICALIEREMFGRRP